MIKGRKTQKHYVIFECANLGIYTSWHECAPNVIGVSKSLYKSYDTEVEAIEAYNYYFESKRNVGLFSNGEASLSNITASTSNAEVIEKENVSDNSNVNQLIVAIFIGMYIGLCLSKKD